MKKLYFLIAALLIASFSYGQVVINEFQPNAAGADPDPASFELKGTPGASFSGWLLSIESDAGGSAGTVDRASSISGTFDANGLLVVTAPDLENPSFTVVLCENEITIGTDLDSDNDGTLDDNSILGTIYDAIGIPDNTTDEASIYGTSLGGENFSYTGDEPGLVFRDGTTNAWYALNEPFNGTDVYDINANVLDASNFSPAVDLSGSFNAINPIYSAPTQPILTITSPSEGEILSPGTTSVNVSINVQNFAVGNPGGGIDGHIHWTINGSAQPMKYNTNDESITVADGNSYTVYMELVDNSHQPIVPAVNATVNFSVASMTQVVDITALRADVDANGVGGFYEITGESLVTHTDSFRNRKWIQDGTISGILIYDQPGTIVTTYNVGDMVTDLRGTTEVSNGVLRFIPTEDSGVVSSSGNSVTPQVVTIADLNANQDDYESELIEIQNVSFVDGDGINVFGTGTNYDVTDGTNTIVKRTDFFNADYIGQLIPQNTLSSLVAVSGEYNGTAQIYVRDLNDFTLSTNNFDTVDFGMYPNPISTGKVTITTSNSGDVTAVVYDVLGKQVINNEVTNNTLDVSTLNAGLYIVKLTQNGNSVTKKLVIK